MSLFTSLLSRVKEYAGPRELSTGTTFQEGYSRQSSPIPFSVTRWHLADLESAIKSSDTGVLKIPGQLSRSLRRDGMISGVLSTRTQGLVQLPLRFAGEDQEIVDELRKEFRHIFPLAELALLAADGIVLGVGVAEFVEIAGSRPMLKRLDPEFLQYRWAEDRWYYQSIHGLLPINPGDGRWVLYCPGGAVVPWAHGLWSALARAYIAKEHAFFFRENYSSKLANAARVAHSPAGANESVRAGFFRKLGEWGVNTVFDLPPGWEVSILESNGRGFEVFQETIKTANEEIQVLLAGQQVTTTGGSGFISSSIFSTIRTDLIQADADALAECLNQQGIACWVNEVFGAASVDRHTRISWDVTPPSDLNSEAQSITAAATAVKAMNEVLAPYAKRVDVEEITRRYGVPVIDAATKPALSLVPSVKEGVR